MPIEIRPSDVMAEAGRALGQWADVAGGIFNAEYEKERVKQVNDFLIINETQEQKEVEDYQYGRKMVKVLPVGNSFDVPPEVKTIGDASFSDVMKDHAESVKARENEITLRIKNKAAREEALQHLRASDLQQRGRLLAIWHRAAGEVAIAGLNTLTQTVKSDQRPSMGEDGTSRVMSPEERLAKIQSRVSEMVVAGWINPTDGQKYMQDAEADIWFTQTLGTALGLATSQTKQVEAPRGETPEGQPEATGATYPVPITSDEALQNAKAFVESSPYYKNRPVEKAELWKRVQSEYKMIADAEDSQKDAQFTELHNNMITVEDGDRALDKLQDTFFHDPMQKYRWHEWLQGERDRIFNRNKLPAGVKSALELTQEAYYKDMQGELAEQQNAGMSLPSIRQNIIDARHAGFIDGEMEAKLLSTYQKAPEPVFDGGVTLIKASKLTPTARYKAINDLGVMVKKNPQWTDADVEQAVTNLLKPPTMEKLNRISKNMAGEDATVDALERINEQFKTGQWTGLSDLPEYKDYLDTYASILLEKAHQMFPNEFPEGRTKGSVAGSFLIDSTNGYGRGAGMPILVDPKSNAYSFILDGSNLKLWKAEQAMDPEKIKEVSATKIGEYYWYPVLPAGGAKGAESITAAASAALEASAEWKVTAVQERQGKIYERDSHGWFVQGQKPEARTYLGAKEGAYLDDMAAAGGMQ